MTLDADNVDVAATGAVYVAPYGSAAPSDFDSTLDPAFKDVGYLSETGVSITPNETITKLQAWQKGETVKTIRRGQDITVTFEMIETRNEEAQKVFWGSGATVGSGEIDVASLSGSEPQAIVIDTVDGDLGVRYYFPKAVLSERGTISLVGENYVAYPVTFECQSDGTRFAQIWHEAEGS
jgi:hypothetical protein